MDLSRKQAEADGDIAAQYQAYVDAQYQEWAEREHAASMEEAEQSKEVDREILPKPIALQAFFDIQRVLSSNGIKHALRMQSWFPNMQGNTSICLRMRAPWPLAAPISFQLDEIAARLDLVFYPTEAHETDEGQEEMVVQIIQSLAFENPAP